ncbi:MAG: TfoX/Sxy family protein [Candidatus Binatia bacterium]
MKKSTKRPASCQPRRPLPLHQGTLDEAVARLGLREVTTKRMFGGLCYYVENRPFAILLGPDLALKLPAVHLRDGCSTGDGRVFNPGGGDFLMREYLALSEQALADEAQIDTYVLASYRFMAKQGHHHDEGLTYEDLRRGREGLYKKTVGQTK